ncbi:MAG TPA: hypothetical protein VN759_06225 [Pseudolysinimonas sp.]|nr:hypothetical protein [Pseudolysinimonas sp.]
MTAPSTPTGPDAPPENVQRGIAFAFIALPLGIIAWDLLWSFGFIASIVALGIAWLALRLYRVGSGGSISRPGAIGVTAITVGTLVLAFISGYAVDVVGIYAGERGISIPEALVTPGFWGAVFASMATGGTVVSFVLAVVFGLLGCFGILRTTFVQTRGQQAGAAAPGAPAPRLMLPPEGPSAQDRAVPPVPPAPRDGDAEQR